MLGFCWIIHIHSSEYSYKKEPFGKTCIHINKDAENLIMQLLILRYRTHAHFSEDNYAWRIENCSVLPRPDRASIHWKKRKKNHRLTGIGIPIIKLRWSDNRLGLWCGIISLDIQSSSSFHISNDTLFDQSLCTPMTNVLALIFTRGQFWPSGIVIAPVCVSVSVCVYQSLACPHDNSSAVQARITKFET